MNALGAWQNGWNEKKRSKTELGKVLQECALELPPKYRSVHDVCYRKRFLYPSDLPKLLLEDCYPESISSWTLSKRLAEEFKGLIRSDAVTGAIFKHFPKQEEVIINICELWKCDLFIKVAEDYKENGGVYSDAIFNFKDKQFEVVLNSPLKSSELIALTGLYPHVDDQFCEMNNIPNSDQDAIFQTLIGKGIYPGNPGYTTEEGAQNVLLNTLERYRKNRQ